MLDQENIQGLCLFNFFSLGYVAYFSLAGAVVLVSIRSFFLLVTTCDLVINKSLNSLTVFAFVNLLPQQATTGSKKSPLIQQVKSI